MRQDLKEQFSQIADEAEWEFDKDGGLSYSESVMQKLETDLTFDAGRACVMLSLLHRMVLGEYGSVVEQLEKMGIQMVALPTGVKT